MANETIRGQNEAPGASAKVRARFLEQMRRAAASGKQQRLRGKHRREIQLFSIQRVRRDLEAGVGREDREH